MGGPSGAGALSSRAGKRFPGPSSIAGCQLPVSCLLFSFSSRTHIRWRNAGRRPLARARGVGRLDFAPGGAVMPSALSIASFVGLLALAGAPAVAVAQAEVAPPIPPQAEATAQAGPGGTYCYADSHPVDTRVAAG